MTDETQQNIEDSQSSKSGKTWLKAILAVPLIVILTPLLLAAMLYIPPVQQWAVGVASRYASEETGMDVSVGKVRLAFPLDLSVEDVLCLKQNDSLPQLKDTIADIRKAVVDVRFLPLLDGEISLNAIELLNAKLNTSDFIHEARVKGKVERLAVECKDSAPVIHVALNEESVSIGNVILDNAHLDVALSDTVPEDTTKTESKWRISIADIAVSRSDILLHMPGDTLQIGANLSDVRATDGLVDMEKKLYQLASLAMKDCDVRYDNNYERKIAGGGLDPNHIALNDISLRIDSLRYLDPELKLKVSECSMQEQCGIKLQSLVADIALDSTKVNVDGTLKTPASSLYTKLSMDLNAFDDVNPGNVKATVDASLGRHDLMLAAASMPKALREAWPQYPLNIKADVSGNMKQVVIPQLSMDLPTAFALDASGNARGFMDLSKNPYTNSFAASLHANLRTYNMNFVKAMLDRSTAKTINIPSVNAVADLNVHGADYDVALKATEGRGYVVANTRMNLASMAYKADVKANTLQLGHFVKGMQLGAFTGKLTATGQGTDFTSSKTRLDAKAEVEHFTYGKYNMSDMTATAALHEGKADVFMDMHNKLIDGTISLNALLAKDKLDAKLVTELKNVDLYRLFLVDVPLNFSVRTNVDVASDFKDYYKVHGTVNDIIIIDTAKTYRPDNLTLDILTRKDTTIANVDCGDFMLRMNAQGGYKYLLGTSDRLLAEIDKQLKERTIDQTMLRESLPRMTVKMHCSQSNPIYRFIKYYDIDYKTVDVDLVSSREDGINGKMSLGGLSTQGYQLDTVTVDLVSHNDPYEITYNSHIQNVAPNKYVFDVYLAGKVLEHGASLYGAFFDADHKLGMKIGAEATMVEEGISFHIIPDEPIIAYKPFRLREPNYVLLGKNNRVFADIDLKADDGTGIQLYSSEDESEADRRQDLTLSVSKLNLANFLSAIPYAPRVEGLLYGDVHFVQEADEKFTLSTDLTTQNMVYEGCPIGNIGMQMVYMPKDDGAHYVDGRVALDDNDIADIVGSYNFNTEKVDAVLNFYKFPMQIVNGFVPNQIVGLDGLMEGKLDIHGTTSLPQVDGELFFDSASIASVPYGVRMRFERKPVKVANSRLQFENFHLYSNNNQTLNVHGEVDFSVVKHTNLNLRMRADNFLLVDAKETRRSEAYGQAYINFFALMQGELDKLKVRGKLEVLPSTNLYYILRDSPLTTDNRLKELVTFTDLNAEEQVTVVRPPVDGLDVNLTIAVDNGSHIKCWLNDAHSNYVDIIGEGDLRMKYLSGDITLTGRYTINEGEMKYSLPVIPLKTFRIEEGSSIEFTGDMMNPRLNITATEKIKSSVEVNGTNQLVTFNTGVRISKTLNDMGLEFTIEAPENQIITDELNMKSAEERGKLAVTMLTTGMYLSDGNTSPFSMNSALNSFLQSEINNIAGSALRTLDLSFGMDNSTEEDGTMHTNYSFKFAKRFWNNRLAISVGGKISTGPDVSGQNKSFFDNVEAQYRLSDISNQYMHLFYKHSVYDFLEGYVGQYGGGYIWKKKVQKFRDIFRNTSTAPTPADTTRRSNNMIQFKRIPRNE